METDTNPTEAASSEEEEKIYNIGEAAQLKDWEITVASMQIVPTVSADYGEFRPDEEGNQYAQIAATVSNKEKQTDKFLPFFGFGDDVSVKLLFGDGYEFSATQLLGYDKDLHDASINPLSSQEGEIFFEIPEAVINSTDEILVKFSSGNDETAVKVR